MPGGRSVDIPRYSELLAIKVAARGDAPARCLALFRTVLLIFLEENAHDRSQCDLAAVSCLLGLTPTHEICYKSPEINPVSVPEGRE